MRNWFKRNDVPKTPTVDQMTIGAVEVRSGTALIADPMSIYDPVRIECVPPGSVPVEAQVIRYPNGGKAAARIGLRFRPGEVEARREVGTIGVDSAQLVLVDAQGYGEFWMQVGPERIGRTSTPKDHLRVARLVEKKFGLKSREVSMLHSEFLEPISEELEARINAYLQTFPEYAEFTYMYFRVETGNTFTRIQRALTGSSWSEIVLDEPSGMNLLAVALLGDGSYTVEGLYRSGELIGVEVELISPEEEEILADSPPFRF